MSMTESEREEILSDIRDGYIDEWDNLTIDELFKQIENEHKEIQQYRALEEKLSGITVKEVVEHFIKTVENQTEEDYIKGRILTNKEAEEWEQMKAIGTVSEFRELKEKATANKKYCKCCGRLLTLNHEMCYRCGTRN